MFFDSKPLLWVNKGYIVGTGKLIWAGGGQYYFKNNLKIVCVCSFIYCIISSSDFRTTTSVEPSKVFLPNITVGDFYFYLFKFLKGPTEWPILSTFSDKKWQSHQNSLKHLRSNINPNIHNEVGNIIV